ncbi:MAG: hypothetical protein KBF99_06475 [Leptospiraceae bacterium]|nr:hypothetical protein [Leptospiraceae bacterium]MBK7054811.1 hypothetical protein [Leptospiraceae bacterium]MBK9502814.1 hypothetical protein [Leptospiraceae bacterium]MBL0262727.1 hypothetical protein [Leptospiraceae bacterium]MBP9162807.1 hypothetical protein [Leptospiraceae bacterium]
MNLKLFFLTSYLFSISILIASIETNNCKPLPIFQCESLGTEAKIFYDTLGEWNGIYTMQPVRIVQDKIGICHIKYFYTPVKGSNATDTGYDFRIFYYTLDNKTCKWKVARMNSYMSGVLAYD